MTLAKGLGGGVPIGAVVTTDEISKVMTPGTHGTTFGGNPLVCKSASAVLDIIKKEHLVDNASKLGKEWMDELKQTGSEKIKDVRGSGFIIGIEMDSDDTAAGIRKAMLDSGILVNVCHGNVVRLIPPLILSGEQKDRFMSVFSNVI
jgi:acetylornithine aminotransferase/acetylornithine/N-succinyldiaminopimelate aminotransferase